MGGGVPRRSAKSRNRRRSPLAWRPTWREAGGEDSRPCCARRVPLTFLDFCRRTRRTDGNVRGRDGASTVCGMDAGRWRPRTLATPRPYMYGADTPASRREGRATKPLQASKHVGAGLGGGLEICNLRTQRRVSQHDLGKPKALPSAQGCHSDAPRARSGLGEVPAQAGGATRAAMRLQISRSCR